MKDFSIRKKIVLAMSIVECLTIALMLYAILTMRSINRSYKVFLDENALSALAEANNTRSFYLILTLIIGVVVMFGIVTLLTFKLSRGIRLPVSEMVEAAQSLAAGDADVDITYRSRDEIGELGDAFRALVEAELQQASIISRMADGDFTVELAPRSERDHISMALNRLIDNNNVMLTDIRLASEQVASAAEQIALGAQSLATGSTQQSANIEQFSILLDEVHKASGESAVHAREAANDASKAGVLMEAGQESMDQMAQSMQQIEESSNSINRIIKVIDDIAFQTNILALNAAVEAARAGAHGKGFAVVADEVRNLATKSAEAASETAQLIDNSNLQVHEGQRLMEMTRTKLSDVMELALRNTQAVEQIAEQSETQKRSIDSINSEIGQISSVIHANAATSEQSAAAAEELSAQSHMLREIVERFQLKPDTKGSGYTTSPEAPPVNLPELPEFTPTREEEGFALTATDKYA